MKMQVFKKGLGYDLVAENAFTKHFDSEASKNKYLFKLKVSAAKTENDIWVIPVNSVDNTYEFYIFNKDGYYYKITDASNKPVIKEGKEQAITFAKTLNMKKVFTL